jgi:polyisoprenoid-binding protein YceI
VRSRALGLLAAAALLAPSDAGTAGRLLPVDPHSTIARVQLRLGLFPARAEFPDVSGHVRVAPEDWGEGEVDLRIRADTLRASTEWLARRFRSPAFLDVANHPELAFKSTRIERTSDDRGRIEGELTLVGVTRPVELEFVFETPVAIRAHGHFRRSEFGITALRPLLSDRVEIAFDLGLRD